MEKMVIIGAGPAGVTAAIYAARSGIQPLILEHGKSALLKAEKIENYYGFPEGISGKELYENGIAQAKRLGVRVKQAEVLNIQEFDDFEIQTQEEMIHAKTVVLATGSSRISAKIPGLQEMEGKGVSYCAVCDAFFYRGKKVAVLGNGDFALHEAREIAHTASSVTILTDGKEPAFSEQPEFPVRTEKIISLEGEAFLEGILLAEGERIEAAGLFVAIGTLGSSQIARQLGAELGDKSVIVTDENGCTSVPGLYAAGDCAGGLLQIAKAVHDGAKAGMHVIKYLNTHKQSPSSKA